MAENHKEPDRVLAGLHCLGFRSDFRWMLNAEFTSVFLIFVLSLSCQCSPASVVRCVSNRVQQQPVGARVNHSTSVQFAAPSAHPLLLPPTIQQQLQDDGSFWLETRDGPGAGGRRAASASVHCSEEGPEGAGIWGGEKSQSYSLSSRGWKRSEATGQGERTERREITEERGEEEAGATRQELGKRLSMFLLSLTPQQLVASSHLYLDFLLGLNFITNVIFIYKEVFLTGANKCVS